MPSRSSEHNLGNSMAVPASRARNNAARAIRNVIVASFGILWVSPSRRRRARGARGRRDGGRGDDRLELGASAGDGHRGGDHSKNDLTRAEGDPESELKD